MASGHSQHGMGMGSHMLEKLMSDRDVITRLYQNHEINRDYDLPYLGGYSVDGKTIYLDRHLPDKVIFEVDGKSYDIDPVRFLCNHEKFEKAVMDALGWAYSAAHEAATGYERRSVLAAGIPWRGYQNAMKHFIKADEAEALQKVPANLDMKPYYSPPPDRGLIARMEKAMKGGEGPKKHTKAEVDYGPGHAKTNCGGCKHFEAPHGCELVRGFIEAKDWCVLWAKGE